MCRLAAALLTLALTAWAADPAGRIMRPTDGAWLPDGKVDIIARAEGGSLTIDGAPIEAAQPFPNVFHAAVEVSPGEHEVVLRGSGGTTSVRFFVGGSPPAGFELFVSHPPAAIECAHCHGLSRRGRFRFTGGCFTCHAKDEFTTIHSHEPHVLVSCGMCHNAHGSTAAKFLLMPREKACKQCHT